MSRFIKDVVYKRTGRNGQGPMQPITTMRFIRVRRYRLMNPPRAIIHINEDYCKPVKFGF